MRNRKKIMVIFGVSYLFVSSALFLGIKKLKGNFTPEKLDFALTKISSYRDKTEDLCTYRILGDPEKVGKKYVKINFWCDNSGEARSTLSLEAVNDKSIKGVLTEYSRIIGFDYTIIERDNWICIVNDQHIVNLSATIVDAATIDCFENDNLFKKKDQLKTAERNI